MSSSKQGKAPSSITAPTTAAAGSLSSEGSKPQVKFKQNDSSTASVRRYKYSTDDDKFEVEDDLEREFREGYQEGLKRGLRHRSVAEARTQGSSHQSNSKHKSLKAKSVNSEAKQSHVEYVTELSSDLDHGHHHHVTSPHNEANDHTEDHHDHADDDSNSIRSNSSVETFTLRERQDAINTTHPFGIRIWKPAVYKKFRSVQRIADTDIHSQPGRHVGWSIWFGNVLWTIIFGTILLTACTFASALCMAVFWSDSSQEYGRCMFHLGTYLFFPFGKYVQLAQDENYLEEDEGQGRSVAEYRRWQAGDLEDGRLFFAAEPTRRRTYSTSGTNNGSGRPARLSKSADSAPEELCSATNSSATEMDLASNLMREISSSRTDMEPNEEGFDEEDHLLTGLTRRRFFGRGKWNVGRVLFYFLYWTLLFPLMTLISCICWLCVFSIPMAKLSAILSFHLRRHPLALSFRRATKQSANRSAQLVDDSTQIILCTYRAWGWKYYKYTLDGTNVIIINLMFPVLFVIFDYYVISEIFHYQGFISSTAFVFSMSLMSIIPLAYFIGQAVASISAQTSMGMGAVINAFFSTVVEVFLYGVALSQGKGELVEGSIVGSLFTGVLILPGLSMCAGAIKRKTQRYNPRSAGVSSTMLVFAVIGAFAPTIFYQIFGVYEMVCPPCFPEPNCRQCYFAQVPLMADAFYFNVILPLCILCAVLLFVAYIIGLWFTLRTHAAMIWAGSERDVVPQAVNPGAQNAPVSRKQSVVGDTAAITEESQGGGHDAPNWSRTKSTVILLGATVLYAIIAEILVSTVDVVLKNISISEKFLGISIFALVPNTTEFLNAISFAMNGNVALSMEIGSAYALQVCLLQIPAVVIFSATYIDPHTILGPIKDYIFTLVFPRWDLYMALFAVFMFTYVYGEGRSNYFKGSILILTYLVVMAGFWYADQPYLEAGISSKGVNGYA